MREIINMMYRYKPHDESSWVVNSKPMINSILSIMHKTFGRAHAFPPPHQLSIFYFLFTPATHQNTYTGVFSASEKLQCRWGRYLGTLRKHLSSWNHYSATKFSPQIHSLIMPGNWSDKNKCFKFLHCSQLSKYHSSYFQYSDCVNPFLVMFTHFCPGLAHILGSCYVCHNIFFITCVLDRVIWDGWREDRWLDLSRMQHLPYLSVPWINLSTRTLLSRQSLGTTSLW